MSVYMLDFWAIFFVFYCGCLFLMLVSVSTYLLDFEDPLFEQIGSTFVGLVCFLLTFFQIIVSMALLSFVFLIYLIDVYFCAVLIFYE